MSYSEICAPIALTVAFFVFCCSAEAQHRPAYEDGDAFEVATNDMHDVDSTGEDPSEAQGRDPMGSVPVPPPPSSTYEASSRTPDPVDSEDAPWGHFEFTMGFLAGQQSYEDVGFASDSGGVVPADALRGSPYDRTEVFGLRYDVRLVVSYVRMTAGIDFPFTSFAADAATRDIAGGTRTVDSLKSYALRFGIGAEYPVGPVAPFIDIIGAVHWIDTSVLVDGATSSYGATDFGFSARGGVRLQVRRWFFASIAAEVGIIGPIRWGAELSVGFSLGPED